MDQCEQRKRQRRTQNFSAVTSNYLLTFIPPVESNLFINHLLTRYFKLKPKVQKLFPDFADIDPTDLSTNDAFTARAGTCVSALNSQMKHLGENPKKCPFLGASIAAKHYHSDLKANLYLQHNCS